MTRSPSPKAIAVRRGLVAGSASLLLVALAAAPGRAAGARRVAGGLVSQVVWAVAGVLRDVSAVILVIAPLILALAALVPWVFVRLRSARWQHAGPQLVAVPLAFLVWLFGVTAQEFKAERGSFPTIFDLAEGTSSTSFLRGLPGFISYDTVWIPALVFGLTSSALVVARTRRKRTGAPVEWRPWLGGVALAFAVGALLLRIFATSTEYRAFGDPFRAIVESAVDLVARGGAITPRDLVRDAELPDRMIGQGATLIGWPPPHPASSHVSHPHARPLDRASELRIPDERGEALVRAFERVSPLLFAPGERGVIVWQLALESFRADDLHALNARAPRETAPFVNGLYEAAARGGQGVLASRSTYQAGVRTAQGLAALTCGLGTLPYNLSFIRDLMPFPLRCLSDVLSDAGFRGSFFYGSDASFDEMAPFLRDHGYADQVTQTELPSDLPKGAWGAVSDVALVDAATGRIATAIEGDDGPRFAMVMTMTNHSPFTPPTDLPDDVTARVDHALASVPNHATDDDRARLLTHSYTDAALARFFARLEELHLAERSIVVLAADHSTGQAYVWGPETFTPETDDQKARIPLAIVLPRALLDRARDRPALDAALGTAQRELDAAPLSQNDIPALTLALLGSHDAVKSMPDERRWHTLGGQITSPWFRPPPRPGAYVFGINGVSELYALDRAGARAGPYEESVFLKTRSDRYSVTPSLVPVTATLAAVMHDAR